jgi:peptide/nickel transport system ATP-binding protein
MIENRPLLEVKNLKMHFPIRRGLLKRVVGHVKAVDDVTFTIQQGETLGLVGESGCGKTTVGRCIVRAYKPSGGKILYHEHENLVHNVKKLKVHARHTKNKGGASEHHAIDFAKLSQRDLQVYRSEIQMIFQDPFSSLNPRMTVLDIVAEPLVIQTGKSAGELKDVIADLLRKVGLRPEHMNRYPNAFSGGQRQRISIARTLALQPNLIVCDEPVSALDVSVQAQVVNLLQDLQRDLKLTYLFISHDLSVVEHICNRIAVMYLGAIPYTEALLGSVPSMDPDNRGKRAVLSGEVPDPSNPPAGCSFHTRCPYAQEICKRQKPAWQVGQDGHGVACHFADDLNLSGVMSTA